MGDATPYEYKKAPEYLLDGRGNRHEVTQEMEDFRASFPPIEDNAKGVDAQQLCQVFVVTRKGDYFQFPPTPRNMLEAGVAFDPLYRLHTDPESGGLKSIKVEVCDAKPVIQNAT